MQRSYSLSLIGVCKYFGFFYFPESVLWIHRLVVHACMDLQCENTIYFGSHRFKKSQLKTEVSFYFGGV